MSWTNGTAYGLDSGKDTGRWEQHGLCGSNPDFWFPIGDKGPALTQAEQAKAICRKCPVLANCEKWVLENPQGFGVFAAMTPDERLALGGRPRRPTVRRCKNEHPLNEETVRVTRKGRRVCRQCAADREKRYRRNVTEPPETNGDH